MIPISVIIWKQIEDNQNHGINDDGKPLRSKADILEMNRVKRY